MELSVDGPFGDQPIDEVHLDDAPLIQVVCQIRFPRLTALATGGETIANAYASSMADRYPILELQHEMNVRITPEGVTTEQDQSRYWQLRSGDDEWQLAFSDSFLSVTTAAYTSRDNFIDRLIYAWAKFTAMTGVPFVERIGVRYINRIEDPELLETLPDLIRAEALGGVSATLEGGVQMVHSLQDALYRFDETNGLQARWGMLPPGVVVDPAVAAASGRSWLLDLDAFRSHKLDPAVDEVSRHVADLAERGYRYFRWVVKDAFLARFGGNPA